MIGYGKYAGSGDRRNIIEVTSNFRFPESMINGYFDNASSLQRKNQTAEIEFIFAEDIIIDGYHVFLKGNHVNDFGTSWSVNFFDKEDNLIESMTHSWKDGTSEALGIEADKEFGFSCIRGVKKISLKHSKQWLGMIIREINFSSDINLNHKTLILSGNNAYTHNGTEWDNIGTPPTDLEERIAFYETHGMERITSDQAKQLKTTLPNGKGKISVMKL